MLLSQNIPNLINGVSQQADALRYPSQCIEQINFFPTVLRGQSKRPPTTHVKELSAADVLSSAYAVHKIDRSSGERFELLIGSGGIKVFDLLGNEKTVTAPSGWGYLSCADPATQLRALTVADYTFILNTTQVVQSTAHSPSNVRAPEALVFIKQVRDGADYKIKLYDSPSNSTPDHVIAVTGVKLGSTSTYTGPLVAAQGDVMAALNVAIGASAVDTLYHHFVDGELLYLVKKDDSDFRIEIESSISEGMFAFKDSVQSFALLPKRGWADFRIRVLGDPDDNGDDYYLKFVPQDANTTGFGEGSWQEAQAQGLSDDALVASSMPHALVNHGTHFEFAPLAWVERLVGDQQSNPVPSFVGRTIQDVFFRKNRLGFLSGENEILSRAGDFFNFWRSTVIQLLDSDVIDVGSEGDVGTLRNAVSVNKRLVLFSEQAQSINTEGENLTPKTLGIDAMTRFPSTVTVRPEVIGNSVFFPFKRDAFSGVIEYAVTEDGDNFDGYEVTEHAPNYIKGTVQAMAASDSVIVVKGAPSDTLYVYKFFRQGRQRVQSSWGQFKFDGTIRGFNFFDSRLYLILLRGGKLVLEYVDLTPGLSDVKPDGTTKVFITHLDRRITEASLTASYNAGLDETTLTLPYTPATNANVRAVSRGTAYGTSFQVLSVTGNAVKVRGNLSAEFLWVGEVYRSEQELSKAYFREQRGDGTYVVSIGRYQVKTGTISADDTLDFRVEVTPLGRPTFSYSFAARVLGTSSAVSGSALVPRTAPMCFPVYSKNDQVSIKIVNDSYLPCNLLSLDWEALYAVRSRRA